MSHNDNDEARMSNDEGKTAMIDVKVMANENRHSFDIRHFDFVILLQDIWLGRDV